MRKSILMVILMIIVLVLSVSIVSATMTGTDVTLGDENTEAANPNADDGDGEDSRESETFTLTNSGDEDITDLVCTIAPESGYKNINSDDEDDFEDDLDMNLTIPSTTIENGTSITITVDARIPAKLDAVDSDGDASSFKTATITCTGTEAGNTITETIDVNMQRENKLELKKVYVTSDKHDHKSYKDGDEVDELKPEEDIEVEIKAENIYDKDDDVEIDGITAYVVIDDGDMDIDEDKDLNDLDPDEDDLVTISFDIEDDVDEDTYTGEIYVIGDDEFGARHGEKWEIEWKVEREKYEFVIKKAELDYDEVSCSRSNSIAIKIESIGDRGDDEVSVYAKNADIGIDFKKEDIELDEYDGDDNTYSKTISFTVPDDLKAGTYTINVQVWYSGTNREGSNEGVLADDKDVVLTVKDCATAVEEEEEEEEEIEVITDEGTETAVPPSVSEDLGIVETTETSFRDSTAYAVILIAAIVVALGSGIVLIVKFLIL